MGKAISSGLEYVKSCCPPGYYRDVWDRLCDQLFGIMPPGMNGEEQIPGIHIWKDGVVRVNDTEPYTFTVETDSPDAPKAGDVILYKKKYYVIGAVE